MVVSRAFAKAYFPGESALRQARALHLRSRNRRYRRIIGVVADIALIDLDQPPPAVIFELNEHSGDTYLSYLVRTTAIPSPPSAPRAKFSTTSTRVSRSSSRARSNRSRSKLHPYFCAAILRS